MITKETPSSRINAFRKSFLLSTSTNVIFKHFFVVGKGYQYRGEPDILVLDIEENMNNGKIYEWFSVASKMLKNQTHVHELSGIVKMDTDCIVNWTKLDTDIFSINLSKNYFIGRPNTNSKCGGGNHCPPEGCMDFSKDCWIYMSGGWYALNFHLVETIMNCTYAHNHRVGIEDLMVGQWILHCSNQNVYVWGFENGIFFCHSGYVSDLQISNIYFNQESCQK